jgi:glycosyltransferase involved in cell wall biosynthesis
MMSEFGDHSGDPLRVALVYRHFNVQGSLQRYHVELARYLVDAGHEVHVYSTPSTRDSSLVPGAVHHDVPVLTISGARVGPAAELASFAWRATKAIRRDSIAFDTVHARAPSVGECDIFHLPGVVNGELRRHRATRSEEGLLRKLKDLALPVTRPMTTVRLWLERQALRNPALAEVHVDSELVRSDLLACYPGLRVPIQTVSPGVNLEEFRPPSDRRAVRKALSLPQDSRLILFCGHDFERKGLDRAILALARMREDADLVVVGGGEREPYLRLEREAGLQGRVHYAGPRRDAWRYYQAADVVALPTRVDMWGTSVVEAMASGVPPVTTAAAGSAAVVDESIGIVLPDPLSLDAFAAALDRLVGDEQLRRRLGTAARGRASSLTWTQHGRAVEQAMHRVRNARLEADVRKPPPKAEPALKP